MDAGQMRETLGAERDRGLAAVQDADSLDQLEAAQVSILGRRSPFSAVQKALGGLDPNDRKTLGMLANEVRAELTQAFADRRAALEDAAADSLLGADAVDLSLPGRASARGSLHPLTLVEDQIVDVFTRLGFTVVEGPEIEDDWHNFQALNIPIDHPARTMKDSLYVAIPGHPELLLRTETSAAQIRAMQSQPPPVYIVAPGRVYRRETSDPTHLPVFHQVECLVVDEGITFADLKGTLEAMAKGLFGESRRIRLGPAYFPFVEPGAEVGVSCFICDGVGCRVCGNGWIELLGAGMVHPQVLENCGYDSERYTGFAFGIGIERVALLRYAIPDIRMLVDGDIHFLEQWGSDRVRVPSGWLRELVPTDVPTDELADLMTHRGVKVEGLLDPWTGLDGVLAVRVLDVRDHPDSDTLCVARIQHGSGESELVVGVRNMVAGDLVLWAPPGARVPVLDEPLGVRRLRGVESSGMLCSLRELGLGTDHTGILVIDEPGWEIGDDLKTKLELDRPVLDVEVEPNRPDFLSIRGVAREVAVATGVPIVEPSVEPDEVNEAAADVASVRLDAPDGCPRYVARVIRGVTHGRSPLMARARLVACGMRPIDAVVDATNYAMLELGQPLHGFDLATLAGPGIVVRRAKDGEVLTTLDDIERVLTEEDLLICDLEQPIALAGIMGGLTSEVTATTTDVLLESAYFTRGGVLLTARRLDLHSEASHRFERGTDPEGLDRAAARGAQLISTWTGGTVLRGVAAAGDTPPRHRVSMRPTRASALLGYAVEPDDARAVFDALGFAHRDDDGAISVEVPGYRTDIDREVDLIEEIVRIQGYERVGSTHPRAPVGGAVPPAYAFARRAKDSLVRAGLHEVRPLPFASQEDLDLFGDEDAVPIANPLRAEEGFLRTRLTSGLIDAVARNRDRGVSRVAIFEVGVTFRMRAPFEEIPKAAWAVSGPADEGWSGTGRELDVLDAKGVLESVLADLRVTDWSLGPPPPGPFHPTRSAQVLIAGSPAGLIGELHPSRAAALGIEERLAVGVIGLRRALEARADRFELREVPRFPPVRRDLAFIVPESVAAGDVAATIRGSGGALLSDCLLFDVFRGGQLPDDHKSLAFALAFRAPDRTLTDEEVQPVVDAIAAAVAEGSGGQLRAG